MSVARTSIGRVLSRDMSFSFPWGPGLRVDVPDPVDLCWSLFWVPIVLTSTVVCVTATFVYAEACVDMVLVTQVIGDDGFGRDRRGEVYQGIVANSCKGAGVDDSEGGNIVGSVGRIISLGSLYIFFGLI